MFARRVGHHPRVGPAHAAYVGPVLVDLRPDRLGRQRAGDVRAAPGKQADFAVRLRAVKAGQHHAALLLRKRRAQSEACLPLEQPPLRVEADHTARVYELPPKVRGQQARAHRLAPARGISRVRQQARIGLVGRRQTQLLRDAVKPRPGPPELSCKQQVGDLLVALPPFAGRGDHRHPPRGVALQQLCRPPKAGRVRQRRAAEFRHLHIQGTSLRSHALPSRLWNWTRYGECPYNTDL